MDAYQHSSDGTFHLCSISEAGIGYTDKYDVRITSLDHIIPDAEIQAYLVGGYLIFIIVAKGRQMSCKLYSDIIIFVCMHQEIIYIYIYILFLLFLCLCLSVKGYI